MFLKEIEQFKEECKTVTLPFFYGHQHDVSSVPHGNQHYVRCIQFQEWLSAADLREYGAVFMRNGIMTLSSLYYHVHEAADLVPIIGAQNQAYAELIWKLTPKQSRKM